MPATGACAELHFKLLQLKSLQSKELIGVFFHTQVDVFLSPSFLSDYNIRPDPLSLEK